MGATANLQESVQSSQMTSPTEHRAVEPAACSQIELHREIQSANDGFLKVSFRCALLKLSRKLVYQLTLTHKHPGSCFQGIA